MTKKEISGILKVTKSIVINNSGGILFHELMAELLVVGFKTHAILKITDYINDNPKSGLKVFNYFSPSHNCEKAFIYIPLSNKRTKQKSTRYFIPKSEIFPIGSIDSRSPLKIYKNTLYFYTQVGPNKFKWVPGGKPVHYGKYIGGYLEVNSESAALINFK